MASPRHIPAAAVASGNKENISQDGSAVLDCPVLRSEGVSSANRKKKPAGFNLRKSIAWNPAFFTEEGFLDNSELSVLTGSELMANGSPSSGISGVMSPLCQSGRYGNTYVLKKVAENSRGKFSAKYCSTKNQGKKLFSAVKTHQRDERKESAGTQNSSSARSIQKCIPRIPAGSTPKKAQNPSSTAPMSRTLKKSQPSLPMVPRSTSSVTTVPRSDKKLAPVIAEHTHRVPGLPPRSKINSVSSGPSIEKGVVSTVTSIREEAYGSVKCKNPQISPSSSFGGTATASTFAKPSALRMPSPSVGFFTQENVHLSHGDGAKRNARSCFAGNTSSVVKPPRYKHPEDLKGRLCLTKPLSTNCTTASNLLVLPVTRESNPSTLVVPEKESLSKVIAKYSAKSRNANNQERPDVDCLLAVSGATTQQLNSEKNDGARNSVPTVYNDASHAEGRAIIKETEPTENSYSLKAICSSIIEPIEDSYSLKATCSAIKPIVGSKLSPSCISSQVCASNDLNCQSKSDDLNCQSKSDSGFSAANNLENSYVRETAFAVSSSESDSCNSGIDLLRDFACDHHNTDCSTLIESVETTISADQVARCGSSGDEMPYLAHSNSDLNDSLCHEAKPASSEEPNIDGGMELEANNALAVKETPLVHVGCEYNHNYWSTEYSPTKSEAPMPCVDQEAQTAGSNDSKAETADRTAKLSDSLTEGIWPVLSEEPNIKDKMVLDTNKSSAQEGALYIEKNKAVGRPGTNTILKDHLKNLVPFTEEWLAVVEACGQVVLEQKTGAVQNSPPDKTAPEPSPWSPVKRKAQDVGPFDCTKYSKSVRTSDTS